MNLLSAVRIGLIEIWSHKFRSLLTMLGIILGVSSLVAMSALVKGMEKGATEALVAIGGLKKIRIQPESIPVEQRHLRDQATGITLNDVYALEAGAPLVSSISPQMRISGTLTYKKKTFRPWICGGAWPSVLEMYEHEIAHGRMFNELDDETARNVCVIGTSVRNELFGSPEQAGREIIPVGETIQINGQPFVIIGMFKHYESEQERKTREMNAAQTNQAAGPSRSRGYGSRGNFVFELKNTSVFIPLNTAWIKFRQGSGSSDRWTGTAEAGDPRLSTLEVKIEDINKLEVALQQVRNVLMSTHKGIEDFSFRTQEEWAESIDTFIRNARMSGGLIAGISLLVGGIGIMNIMLASISGRVREIGIRKAVGAGTSTIFIQVLVESVVIAVLGGLFGLVAAYGLVQLLGSVSPTDNEPIITVTALLFAFTSSVTVGILAGLMPAFKAAKLHPIAALRYE